ncbi:hypothetical protein PILCRDRAFT_823564 [Piloderma croceum F 1598]|uniref:Uncharacterized protein n=1 Tax=Piloderma croceum (strain F 1598) TaxID=765440 RepID=A0A0C3AZ78_PILCF|nr:hypothetical protein PILCRDRAFT_823564 [Piloderma croceum F 1598]
MKGFIFPCNRDVVLKAHPPHDLPLVIRVHQSMMFERGAEKLAIDHKCTLRKYQCETVRRLV